MGHCFTSEIQPIQFILATDRDRKCQINMETSLDVNWPVACHLSELQRDASLKCTCLCRNYTLKSQRKTQRASDADSGWGKNSFQLKSWSKHIAVKHQWRCFQWNLAVNTFECTPGFLTGFSRYNKPQPFIARIKAKAVCHHQPLQCHQSANIKQSFHHLNHSMLCNTGADIYSIYIICFMTAIL